MPAHSSHDRDRDRDHDHDHDRDRDRDRDHDHDHDHDRRAARPGNDNQANRWWWLWDEPDRASVPGLRCTALCDLRGDEDQHDPGTVYTHAHHATTGHDDSAEDVR